MVYNAKIKIKIPELETKFLTIKYSFSLRDVENIYTKKVKTIFLLEGLIPNLTHNMLKNIQF